MERLIEGLSEGQALQFLWQSRSIKTTIETMAETQTLQVVRQLCLIKAYVK